MGAKELFQSGKLNEAVAALGAEVRDNPTDIRRRTFLFELLCFQGEFDRAEKHLNLLADSSPDAKMGAVLYFSALHAERLRHDLFAKKDYPATPVSEEPRGGSLNGRPFETLEDADPRIGPRLELFAAGAYLWIPFEHIESIEMQPPQKSARPLVDSGSGAHRPGVPRQGIGRSAIAGSRAVFLPARGRKRAPGALDGVARRGWSDCPVRAAAVLHGRGGYSDTGDSQNGVYPHV